MFVLVNLNCVGCRCHSIKLRPNCLFFFHFPFTWPTLSAWEDSISQLQINYRYSFLVVDWQQIQRFPNSGVLAGPVLTNAVWNANILMPFLPLVLKRSKLSRTHSCLCGLVKTSFWKRGSVLTSENADFIFHCFSLKIRENTEQIPVFKQKRISLCS